MHRCTHPFRLKVTEANIAEGARQDPARDAGRTSVETQALEVGILQAGAFLSP